MSILSNTFVTLTNQTIFYEEASDLHLTFACGVMVIVIGSRHSESSSNPGGGRQHFTFRKGMNPIILPPTIDK